MDHSAASPEVPPLEQLQALEERIVHVVELLKQMRAAREEAENEAARLRTALAEQEQKLRRAAETLVADQQKREAELAELRQQLAAAQRERGEVRQRVEKLLRQIDSLSGD
jgi:chromosome segregation ATPase